MEITASQCSAPAELIQLIQDELKNRIKPEQSRAFARFTEVYLEQFPLNEWIGRNPNDLVNFVYGVWLTLAKRPEEQPFVKVYNPNLDEHGWLCKRTVICVLQRDMPFLVDSLRIELNRRNVPIYVLNSAIMTLQTGTDGTPENVLPGTAKADDSENSFKKETLIYVEVGLITDQTECNRLASALANVFQDVDSVVNSYAPIVEHLHAAATNIETLGGADAEEVEFLQWLSKSHFTFLGYREFNAEYRDDGESISHLEESVAKRAGVFSRISNGAKHVTAEEFSEGTREFYGCGSNIFFSKSNTRSNVHRDVYPDYIVVKKYDDKQRVVGEVRFLGLFTYSVYSMSPAQIPLLRNKMAQLIERSGLDPISHNGKNFIRVIENFPKEEMFQSDGDLLFDHVASIAQINERHVVRLIMREDPFGSFVNCMVYVPKDVYNTQMRLRIQEILSNALGATECDSTTYFSESTLARAQFVFKLNQPVPEDLNHDAVESAILDLTKDWDEYFRSGLVELHGESRGISLYNAYRKAFPQVYQDDHDPRMAVKDLSRIDELNESNPIGLHLFQPAGIEKSQVRFKVYCLGKPVELSEIIPILENLGLRVIGEQPYKIQTKGSNNVWIHDFSLKLGVGVNVDIQAVAGQFEQAFEKIWFGENESDGFNRLVLSARINWREVTVLRAYASYLKQILFTSSKPFIAKTLLKHAEVTRNLIALFKAYFDPRLKKNEDKDQQRIDRLKTKIIDALEQVDNLNEDIVLRRYLDLINGTLRTNYFQKKSGQDKNYISFKFSPRDIAEMPAPKPMFEIFVYSPRVEGVHLRGGKVARGGLRWSDRLEDYRTEVLGLVKAQQVKNAVIVPNGAKGGFVAKQLGKTSSREAFFEEGIACYKIFIQGLLDLTDNLKDGAIIPPESVVRRDEDDPYLVVAADKGTATFSDIANEISLNYGHWLGDAFASGGSQGYDHKGMGITARGAWVSVQRHFRERGVDIQNEDFTVIGVGDMGGDVFGNGMLLSEHIKLVAAFNHLHIFIDPDPDPAISFAERKRLFALPRSNWADYNAELISKGGGIFSRSQKFIRLTPQIKQLAGIDDDTLTPQQLIHALLKAHVDLIWNGGIGTYVKASWETDADVGDKANDGLRVNGSDLHCHVFGEGGNLGMTQLGRLEFSLNGGLCNTDFIDNAAGVDCSDHEVNIKILLDDVVTQGDLTEKQRNEFLADMTDEVSDLVLQNNYRQTFAISLATFEAEARTNEYRRFINFLEAKGKLDRDLEYLPNDDEIVERLGHGKALTRPELSVLISYAKVMLKEELAESNLADDDYIAQEVATAFPNKLRDTYPALILNHRLRKEIIATQLGNDLINNLGITSAHRLLETTGAELSEITRAYVVSRDVFEFEALQNYVRSLDNQVPATFQAELMTNMIRRVRRGTRWFLRNRRGGLDAAKEVPVFREKLKQVHAATGEFTTGLARENWKTNVEHFKELAVQQEWSMALSMPSNMFSGLGLVQISLETDKPVSEVAQAYYLLLEKLNLSWFATQLSEVNVETYWQALARESFIDDLEAQIRKITEVFVRLRADRDFEEVFDVWQQKNVYLIERWKQMVNEVQGSQVTDYAMFSVALRELIDLAQASQHYEELV